MNWKCLPNHHHSLHTQSNLLGLPALKRNSKHKNSFCHHIFRAFFFVTIFSYINSDVPQFWLKEVCNLYVSVSLKCQLFFSKRNENYVASRKFSIFFAMFLFCPLVSWLRNSNFGGSLSAELPSWIFAQIRGSNYPNFNDLKNYLKKDQF